MRLVIPLTFASLFACGTEPPIVSPRDPGSGPIQRPELGSAPDRPRSPREAEVHAAARAYRDWPRGLVQTEPDRAPFDCRAPTADVLPMRSAPMPADSGHGHKLYFLFAKDVAAYREATDLYRPFLANEPPPRLAQPVGQLIVKEAWTDVPIGREATPPTRNDLPQDARTSTWIDGEQHALGERAALFAMMKVGDPGTPDTDQGWIYATLTPDGAAVTSSGLLPTCMRCHTKAPHDRLFGPSGP